MMGCESARAGPAGPTDKCARASSQSGRAPNYRTPTGAEKATRDGPCSRCATAAGHQGEGCETNYCDAHTTS